VTRNGVTHLAFITKTSAVTLFGKHGPGEDFLVALMVARLSFWGDTVETETGNSPSKTEVLELSHPK
jgi:hypothetical protein